MVAENAQIADSSPALTAPKRPYVFLTLASRMKVRNLYVGQSLSRKEIASRTGLTEKQVQNLVSRDKLTALRKRREQSAFHKTDARTQEQLDAFSHQLSEEADEISLGAIARARESVEKNEARDFQSFTGGILNLVKASRAVRGLDQRNAASGGGDSTAVIFVKLERVGESAPKEIQAAQIAEKRADAIEVSASVIPALPESPAPNPV